MSLFRDLVRGTSITLVAGGLSSLVGAIYFIVAVRHMSTIQWGTASVIISFGTLLGGVLNFGDSLHQVRRIATAPSDHRRAIFAENFLKRCVIGVFVLVVAIIVTLVGSLGEALPVAALGIAYFLNYGAQTFLLGNKRFAVVAVMPIIEKTLTLVATALVVVLGRLDVMTLPLLQAGSLLVTCSAMVALSAKAGTFRRVRLSPRAVVTFWSGSTSFGVSSLAPTLMQLDVPIVNSLAGGHQAAMFSIGSRIVSPLGLVGNALAIVVLPTFAGSKLRRPSRRTLVTVICALIGVLLALAAILCLAFWWVPTLFGSPYSGAVLPVQLYVVSVAAGLFTRPAASILQSQGLERSVAVAVSVQIAGALIILAVGAHFGGAVGAALGLCTTNVLLAIYFWVLIIRRIIASNAQVIEGRK